MMMGLVKLLHYDDRYCVIPLLEQTSVCFWFQSFVVSESTCGVSSELCWWEVLSRNLISPRHEIFWRKTSPHSSAPANHTFSSTQPRQNRGSTQYSGSSSQMIDSPHPATTWNPPMLLVWLRPWGELGREGGGREREELRQTWQWNCIMTHMKKGSHDLPQMKTYQQHKMVKSW